MWKERCGVMGEGLSGSWGVWVRAFRGENSGIMKRDKVSGDGEDKLNMMIYGDSVGGLNNIYIYIFYMKIENYIVRF